jgi:transcription-repair coupling factor (superfamily II helicase)
MVVQPYHNNTLQQILARHAEDVLQRLNLSSERRIYNVSIPHFATLLLQSKSGYLVIEDTPEHAEILYHDLQYFASACERKEMTFDYFPPSTSPEFVGERALILHKLATGGASRIITSIDAVGTGFGKVAQFHISKGFSVERELMEMMLAEIGYRKVNIVMEKGEYAERGWLFDIYPVTEDLPIRVEFFGDEIDLIRTFDIETQRSTKKIKELTIYPAIEPFVEMAKDGIEDENSLIQLMSEAAIFLNGKIASGLTEEAAPIQSSLSLREGEAGAIVFSHYPIAGEGIDSGAIPMAGLGILLEERRSIDDVAEVLSIIKKKTIIVLASTAQIERCRSLLSERSLVVPFIDVEKTCSYEGIFCMTKGTLSAGLHLPDLLILTAREIFGEQPAYRPIRKSKVSRLLLTIDDLKPGDFIVHRDHGIGKFIGLQREKIEDYEEDLITLEYAGGDRLYLPFQGSYLLHKYSAGEGRVPTLDRIGGKRWQTAKQKVKKSVKEMADKLLRLYADRRVARGFVFSEDTPMHAEFDEFFPYEETEDQIKAVEEIKRHMQSDHPMDMLICGDVGYGKTEVAIKAAFRAVYDGKQVAVLVPTTLLAEQHYRTFKSRFAAFPVKIDYLSRFKDPKEAKKSIAALAKGEIDMVIGTHMLLNKTLHFQDLGLLIIDEEHRFGVAQKERLKELRRGVDVITLTATPIPRTLHMSLSGIREMSTIETPPEERLAVRSVVTRHNDKTIREAIERELKREGQVFFVHNRINDIERVVSYLKKLVPDARIDYAHGQMAEHQLEKIMLSFFSRQIDVLVSTAIIGSGLDIPTANTMIIDRADTFGLSDLYQLRGRVGRSNLQAYAYFLIPGEDILTEDAKKRLQAIQEMSYLGAGFRLALKDLEIRGAGNLLGGEQSGHIYKVGFDMYMEMLEKAVSELKGEDVRDDEIEPQIKLRLAAFIPEEYISDMSLRLSMYKRLTSIKSLAELDDFGVELTDRFGRMPKEVTNLIHVIRIKLLSKQLFISKVIDIDGHYRFTVGRNESGREYQLGDDFAERMLKVLLEMQKSAKGGSTIRFLQNGFELSINAKSSGESMRVMEDILRELIEKLREGPDGSRVLRQMV